MVNIFKQIAAVASDLKKCGPSFAYAGVTSKLRAHARVPLPGGGQATVRGRDSDFGTLRQVFRDQEYAILSDTHRRRVEARYEAILAEGKTPVIIDAGANIGSAALWFRQQYPQACVVAIEPDPGNAAILRENAVEGIIALEAAVGSEPGHVSVLPHARSWAIRTERADTGCPVVTVEQAARQVTTGSLFIVKVDIEGFESDLFGSNLAWLDDPVAVYLEPHDWMTPGTSQSFQAAFGERDFDVLMRGENLIYVRR